MAYCDWVDNHEKLKPSVVFQLKNGHKNFLQHYYFGILNNVVTSLFICQFGCTKNGVIICEV